MKQLLTVFFMTTAILGAAMPAFAEWKRVGSLDEPIGVADLNSCQVRFVHELRCLEFPGRVEKRYISPRISRYSKQTVQNITDESVDLIADLNSEDINYLGCSASLIDVFVRDYGALDSTGNPPRGASLNFSTTQQTGGAPRIGYVFVTYLYFDVASQSTRHRYTDAGQINPSTLVLEKNCSK